MTVFVRDPAGWKEFTASRRSPIFRDVQKRGQHLHRLATRQIGKETFQLSKSLTTRTEIDARGIVNTTGSANRIAYLHHKGTRPHAIVPKRAKVLRFVQNGRVRYARRVYHPGTRPNKYLTDNLPKVILGD